MKLTIDEPHRRDVWVVRAAGCGGDADAYHVEEIYSGRNENAAKRAYLEALALSCASYADLHAKESRGEYSVLLAPVFARSGSAPGAPFAWASEGWSRDVSSDTCHDAKIYGGEMTYVDEHGAERSVGVELCDQETALLAALSQKFSIDALMAMFDKLEFDAAIPAPVLSKPAPAL